ncbi:MAG: divergent polysaccharide deacetylase family protein [Alphaproteobacteria bacterium]|nr:divergent polysaccharide deacetylase family protein [Alphaproteobacteria bacterium]
MDELNEPLSPESRKSNFFTLSGQSVSVRIAQIAACGLFLLCFLLTLGAFLQSDLLGGEPVAYIELNGIESYLAERVVSGEEPEMTVSVLPDGSEEDIFIVRGVSDENRGKEGVAIITRPGQKVEENKKILLSDSRPSRFFPRGRISVVSLDSRIIERSPMGLLPRIGVNGEQAREIYARPFFFPDVEDVKSVTFISIIVGGLGLNEHFTKEAISRFPGSVSLAFAPYGRDLQSRVNLARSDGHEVLLQLPMEPFGYPDNDPGPHTLLTDMHMNDNLERLYWLMARFTGYVGVMNYLGAKFTASSEDLTPVLQEIGSRGLLFIDDGSSSRSLATSSGEVAGVQVYRGDIVIDAGQTRESIEAALQRLESLAMERGHVVGVATAFPITIDVLSEWMSRLSDRGFELVPLSAVSRLPTRG